MKWFVLAEERCTALVVAVGCGVRRFGSPRLAFGFSEGYDSKQRGTTAAVNVALSVELSGDHWREKKTACGVIVRCPFKEVRDSPSAG